MKNLIPILLLFSAILTASATEINKETAKQVAVNFYFERVSQHNNLAYSDIIPTEIIELYFEGEALLYAVNISMGGFVIVSASDKVMPVVGYSFEGKFTGHGIPPQMDGLLEQYKQQIREAEQNMTAIPGGIKEDWKRLSGNDFSNLLPLKYQKSVEPLLTTTWDQGQFYNEMCPADPAGPGGHCYAGCVATALGQVVNYFRWPETGNGSYTYNCPGYGTLTGDFGNTTYEWDKMPTELNKSGLAIALLLYHLGIACDMQYGPDGSGMYNHKAAYALRSFFKYSPETVYVYRDSTSMDWDSLLISHLDRDIPMYYAGWSVPNLYGHAFVCDGYQDGYYYHFNWGWSGSYDGYFYTNALNPGGSNFNLAQEVIINAFPDTNTYSYPYYCQGAKTQESPDGTIDDGSGPVYNYMPGSDCSWLIAPSDSVENITIDFLRFDTEMGDILTVYDGETTSDPVLGTFQGSGLPASITSSGDKMLIIFTSDASGRAPGWLLSYKSEIPVYCSGLQTLTEQSGTFSDGSGPRDYHNSTTCMWKLEPPGASELTLYFNSFNTEENFDLVKIFDLESSTLLAEYSGDISPAAVTSPSGKMFVTFASNYTITAPGWEVYYETDLVNITERTSITQIDIFPIPANDQINILVVAKNSSSGKVAINNMNGSTLINKDLRFQSGMNKLSLDVSDLTSGIYVIKVGTETEQFYRKLIIN